MPRHLIIGAATAAATLGLAAAPAFAATDAVPLSFNHVVLDTPVTHDAQIVSPHTAPLKMVAQVDPSTGAFTVDPSTFSSPGYSFSSPIPGTATLSLAGPASGTINPATGAVTMTADFLATLHLGMSGSCTVATGNQTLSTAAKKPLLGSAFPAGLTGAVTGNGALGASWSTLPASTDGQACTAINPFIDGPGGVWISRGIDPTAAMAPSLSLAPAKRSATVKAGRSVRVAVNLVNAGGADTKSVKVCVKAPRGLSAGRCQTVKAPKADSKHRLTFTVTAARNARPGSYRLTVSGSGAKSGSVKLKVAKA